MLSLWISDFYTHRDAKLLGIRGFETHRMADNFESEVAFLLLFSHVTTLGVVYSFGDSNRQPITRNVPLVLLYVALISFTCSLYLVSGTFLNCKFRVNCDAY